MSYQEPDWLFFPQEGDENLVPGLINIINYEDNSIPFSISDNTNHHQLANSWDDCNNQKEATFLINDTPMSGFGVVPLSMPSTEMEQTSGAKRKHAFDPLEEINKDGEEENNLTSDIVCTQQNKKTRRHGEVHKLNERLRRQKFKEKFGVLRELIPNCNKRDNASTLDDAIKYIKTLQYQLQMMMSVGAGFSMFHPPMPMMHIPTFLNTTPIGGNAMGPGMGFSGIDPTINFPMTSQLGISDPCLRAPTAIPGLPGIWEAGGHGIQNPGSNVLAPFCFPSSGGEDCVQPMP